MAVWVVAIEYAGPDIEVLHPASRRPVLEHAYDLETGRLAHGDDRLRVGFPRPTRGWPAPAQLSRCVGCTLVVTAVLTDMVADIVGRTVTDLTSWVTRFINLVEEDMWLWAPASDSMGTT